MNEFEATCVKVDQQRLKDLDWYTGPIDAEAGAKTLQAMAEFKRAVGYQYRALPFSGATVTRLFAEDAPRRPKPVVDVVRGDLPWMTVARSALDLHEVRDNARLREFLRSDGKTLGDPAKLPWCGDFAETPLRLTLPDEVLPGNPYLALNWTREFGVALSAPRYGCIVDFWRGSPTGTSGHVAFVVGWDNDYVYCLGGNQSNEVCISKMARSRVRSFKWPKTYPMEGPDWNFRSSGAFLSTNEA